MPLAVLPVEDIDRRQLRELTAQESHTPEGERTKLRMVENHLSERMRIKHEAMKKSLLSAGQMTDDEAERKIKSEGMIQPLDVRHLPVGDGRYALIVGKGSGKGAQYKIMVPGHVDTVVPSADGMMEMETEDDGDTITGLGVHDMGTAILNSIALAVDVEVPEGMQIYFVFLGDEELGSLHARKLIESWEEWEEIKAIITSEIGSLIRHVFQKGNRNGDTAMRLILGRRGRGKYLVRTNVGKEEQGHGAGDETPDTTEAIIVAGGQLRRRFWQRTQYEGVQREPLARVHPLLGKEKLQFGRVLSQQTRSGLFGPDEAELKYSVFHVPDPDAEAKGVSRRRQGLLEQRAVWEEIAAREQWDRWRIGHELVEDPDETSYYPYCMSSSDLVQKVAAEVIELVTGFPPLPDGADSPSDECLFVSEMLDGILKGTGVRSFKGTNQGIVNIPIRGGKPHKAGEWSSWYDTLRVRLVIRHLIENPRGFQRFLHTSPPIEE